MRSWRRTATAALWCVLVGFSAACGITDPSTNSTDTFSGTVVVPGGFLLHTFSVSKNGGELTVKITAISPDTGATFGVRYGQLTSAGDCIAIQQTAAAGLNKSVSFGIVAKGSYCLVVFDNGLNVRDETVTVGITHP